MGHQAIDRGQAPHRALIWPLCSTPLQEQVKLTMRQPLNPKVSGASPASASLLQAMIVISAFLAFMLVLFSDFIAMAFGGYADQRFLLIGLSGLMVIAPILSFAVKPQVSIRRTLLLLSPALILCVAFIALALPFRSQLYVWTEPGMYSFYFLAIVVSGGFLAWANGGVFYSRALISIIAATCLIYGLASVNVYLFAIFDGQKNLINFIPWGFVNIRYWSHIASWCLPLLPLAVMVGPLKEFKSWRIAVLLGAGMWWWILFLTTGRGSALGIAFGVGLTVLLFGRRALPWLKVFAVYLAVGIILWLLLSVLIPTMLSDGGVHIRAIHAGGSGRLPLFVEAWHMSLQNFPLGMGPQSWLTHDRLTETYSAVGKLGHPHNMYLMWAAEYGWALIAALGLVVIQAIRYFWKARSVLLTRAASQASDEKLVMLAALTTSVSAALFHAGVSAVFMAPGSMLVGLFVLIAFWALIIPAEVDQSAGNEQRPRSKWNRVIILAVAAGLSFAWLVWAQGVWDYYQDMREDEELYYGEVGEGMLPRFWFHGNFPR